jgi:transcription factor SOX1/3/14/21 (SOX group B)
MDVSKFALDRNAYLNTAAAIYESTKQQVTSNAYSAYLDPTVLTKAYFDSKMYSDRAASNYAFDISKIYGGGGNQQGGSNLNNNLEMERDSTPQLPDEKNVLNDGHMDGFSNGNGGNQMSYQFSQQATSSPQNSSSSASTPQGQQPNSSGGGAGDYRRPLTVIF